MTHRSLIDAADVADGDTREQERIAAERAEGLRWRATTFIDCDLEWSRVGTVDLSGGRVIDCHVPQSDVEDLTAEDSTWRATSIRDGRIGAAVLARSHLDALSLVDMRIGYLDLRSARATDLTLTDCRIDTLDLTGAGVTGARFPGCQIHELIVTRAELASVDLRGAHIERIEGVLGLQGATVDPGQLVDLAPLLADALGIVVDDAQ